MANDIPVSAASFIVFRRIIIIPLALALFGCAPPLTAEQFAALPPAQQKEELERERARLVLGEALLLASAAADGAAQGYAQAPPINRQVYCTSNSIGTTTFTNCH